MDERISKSFAFDSASKYVKMTALHFLKSRLKILQIEGYVNEKYLISLNKYKKS